MTLIENILKKVQSKDSLRSKYASPPPELDDDSILRRVHKKKRKPYIRYHHVRAKVDSGPPRLQPAFMCRHIGEWSDRLTQILMQNFKLLTRIKRQHYKRGKVDCHWVNPPKPVTEYYEKRKRFFEQVHADNKVIYERILATKARVITTASLEECWQRNQRHIVKMAALPFVLFPPKPTEDVDPVFLAPPGVTRPR